MVFVTLLTLKTSLAPADPLGILTASPIFKPWADVAVTVVPELVAVSEVLKFPLTDKSAVLELPPPKTAGWQKVTQPEEENVVESLEKVK